ncbi:hypothetical protein PAAG_11712 [Paracoccidioides lutzii Pb01]|uniref:Uncharacterized protein n=1 Tax=Paracoccidioides lutzii (strain ATCC MYA-826 / Pb01) TaxID=502779 RepID=A0A0A2VL41_PARBA|nr:hypothetical protein PAAG_11712 [Paracoccidioides lutzii Pb01]KGQ01584.1 hypothetical protein PAAG_11712 [Paracoccidioides lutzii Pb01]
MKDRLVVSWAVRSLRITLLLLGVEDVSASTVFARINRALVVDFIINLRSDPRIKGHFSGPALVGLASWKSHIVYSDYKALNP